MMKKVFLISALMLALFSCGEKYTEDETSGSIAGIVADKATGEPVPTVRLTLSPGGASAVTGSDGSFTFRNLETGNYSVSYSKEGYRDGTDNVILKKGQNSDVHILIERIPAVITADKEILEFGENSGVTSLSFNIVNSSYKPLKWNIDCTCLWISKGGIKPSTEGTLNYGKTATIIVEINRDELKPGYNETYLVIYSEDGSAEVKITAIGSEKWMPALVVSEATEVGSGSANLNGEIKDNGVPEYFERGFVFGLTSNPTVENNQTVTSPKTEESVFACHIDNLTLGKTYYVKSYAKNLSKGKEVITYSSNEITFTTHALAPVVTILDATELNVSNCTATLNAKVENAGDPVYTEKGFVYSENTLPTIYDQKICVEGHDIGPYIAPIKNLPLNKTIYIRGFIKQNGITYYSAEAKHFSLISEHPVSEMISVSETGYSAKRAKFVGNIISLGTPAFSARGFVYGFNSNPTIENDYYVTVTGKETGKFSFNVSELYQNQRYFIRVFTEQMGEYHYSSNELSFILMPRPAAVGQTIVTEIELQSAKATAVIDDAGDPHYTEKGFVYNTSGNPDISNCSGKVIANNFDEDAFSARLYSLSANTTYYLRAYLKQNDNICYGAEVSFTTNKELPEVITNPASSVMYTTATLNATVTTIGTPAYNKRGFYCSRNQNPDASNSTILLENGNSFGDYGMLIRDLEESTTYYYRAFLYQEGNNEAVIGNVMSFTTGHSPNVTTGGVLNVTGTGTDITEFIWSATLYGGLSDAGDPPYTEFGFIYGNSAYPVVNDGLSTYLTTAKFEQNGNARIFHADVAGFITGNTYYIRAVAKTPLGYIYGEPVIFTPSVINPVIRTYSTECKQINGTWAVAFIGLCSSLGQPFATGLGFVYGLNSNPKVGDGTSISLSYTQMEHQDNVYVFAAATGDLIPNKNYYVRVYAKTPLGYTYGESITFRTY